MVISQNNVPVSILDIKPPLSFFFLGDGYLPMLNSNVWLLLSPNVIRFHHIYILCEIFNLSVFLKLESHPRHTIQKAENTAQNKKRRVGHKSCKLYIWAISCLYLPNCCACRPYEIKGPLVLLLDQFCL